MEMIKLVAFLGLSLAATLGLSSCAAPPVNVASESNTKAAGVLGSRLCFINESSVDVSVNTYSVSLKSLEEENSGLLNQTDERCFAGYGAYDLPAQDADVIVSLNIDGRFNSAVIASTNPSVFAPYIEWAESADRLVAKNMRRFSANSFYILKFQGHTYEITRRDDSENYKEFLVVIAS